jgi:tRNA A37 threonylcarbamoyltransferase TsaD
VGLIRGSYSQAFDRIAKALELPPTGSALAAKASLPPLPPFDITPLKPLSLPLSTHGDKRRLEFSFSGLVSFTTEIIKSKRIIKHSQADPEEKGDEGMARGMHESVKREVARVFQDAAIGHLCEKVRLGLEVCKVKEGQIGGLVVSGGVGANLLLRQRSVCFLSLICEATQTDCVIDRLREMLDVFEEKHAHHVKLYFPPVELCTGMFCLCANITRVLMMGT